MTLNSDIEWLGTASLLVEQLLRYETGDMFSFKQEFDAFYINTPD